MKSIYYLMSLFTNTFARNIHTLNENDVVMIKGVISKDSSNKFFSDLQNFNEDQLNIFISSPGGSVIEGMKIIDEIKTYKIQILLLIVLEILGFYGFCNSSKLY